MSCRELACPRCHLDILRDMLETEMMFLSIVGEQASGKSFFLTAMIQQLRQVLFHDFAIKFTDADPASNKVLTGYLDSLFGREDEEAPVALKDLIVKTQMGGDLYTPVTFDQQTISYPDPFVFSMQPTDKHPNAKAAAKLARMLCLYDNAGEHFRPDAHQVGNPCAEHLALSQAILFLFDPSQDLKFRAECRGETQAQAGRIKPTQQVTILNEVARRVKDYAGLNRTELYGRPLIMVLTKFDAWSHLVEEDDHGDPWVWFEQKNTSGIDVERIENRSAALRDLMMRHCRDVVAAAEGFARDVTYIAVSALGDRLHVDERTNYVSIRPRDVQPYWAAVPLLYAVCRALPGLIPRSSRRDRPAGAGDAGRVVG